MLSGATVSDLFARTDGKESEILRFSQTNKIAKMKRLTHISSDGRAQMVDVSAKPLSNRKAVARGKIQLRRETLDLIAKDQIAKGNVLATARIAGIQGAKQTAQLIPLCHALPLSEVNIEIVTCKDGVEVTCRAQTIAQTGVEMEALVGVTSSLLTIYDMCKAVDKDMEISCVRLIEKTKSAAAAVHHRGSRKSRHA
jgi:cyclic pyranopterin phosphate synthase